MKKILPLCVFLLAGSVAFGQDDPKPKKQKIDLSNRANDHFLIQFGYAGWANIPDTINQSGFSKSFNAYFMFDFPFKNNPNLSIAAGAGIGSDHILFASTHVGIKDLTPSIYFTNVADTNNYKKTKLATVYLEAPVEFRYSADPLRGKGFKAAIGVKVGTMINAHTRNTKLQDKSNNVIGDHTMKEASTKFFNKNRLSVMGRVGYSHFSVFASYQVTTLFKEGMGPDVRPFSIGLTLSGL